MLQTICMIKCLRNSTKTHSTLHPLLLSTPHSTFYSTSNNPHPILPLLRHFHNNQHHLDFKILHAHTITSGLFQDPFTSSRLVEFCFISQHPHYAQLIFQSIHHPDLYTWHAMMLGHVKHGSPLSSLAHFVQMLHRGVSPSTYTFALVLKACNSCGIVDDGKEIGEMVRMVHGQIVKNGVEDFLVIRNSTMRMYCNMGCLEEGRLLFDKSLCLDLISWNTMISAYGKCGKVEAGRELFDRMPERSLVSWGAMIDGYVMNGGFSEALRLFNDMQVSGFEPDAMTLVSALKASGNLGALDQGKWVHMYIDKNKLRWERNVVLGTALVDMYAKCGCIDVALGLFSEIHDKDVILWNAMIGGLALHGHGSDALELFFEMRRHETMPNPTTFVTVLSACAHSGMVEMGIEIFKSMKEYNIEPGIEHYGCLADIFGRAGRVHEAEQILCNMPMEPQASQWGALMAACRTYNNVEVGERVGKHLILLEPHDGGRYVLLSNIYAATGRWGDARQIRKEMDQMGAKKETGCSLIERDGIIHEMLDDLKREIKGAGFAQHKSSLSDLGNH